MVVTSPQVQQRKALLFKDEDGYFVAKVSSLPGCVSHGETCAEALENIKEAIASFGLLNDDDE
ncbi:MAG: type II toxin-antitoxin system HicB family antitoxin [Leptolyngbyaceae bacterium]|nr:type II toxin-antitoxin system HicB family antitoxin [Leptolyngbyaceae bacterium]